MQALLSSAYIAGYRVGMIVAGAGALYPASYWGSTKELYVYTAWQKAYWAMAAAMGVGVSTALLMPEQRRPAGAQAALCGATCACFWCSWGAVERLCVLRSFHAGPVAAPRCWSAWAVGRWPRSLVEGLVRLGSALAVAAGAGWAPVRLGLAGTAAARDTWVAAGARRPRPLRGVDGLAGAGAGGAVPHLWVTVPGVISNVFYADMGYSKIEIANAVKTFGRARSASGAASWAAFSGRRATA